MNTWGTQANDTGTILRGRKSVTPQDIAPHGVRELDVVVRWLPNSSFRVSTTVDKP